VVISHGGCKEAIRPLLGELARAGKDHRHLGITDSQPAEPVRHFSGRGFIGGRGGVLHTCYTSTRVQSH